MYVPSANTVLKNKKIESSIMFKIIQIVRFSIEILLNSPKGNICGMFDVNKELLYAVSILNKID